MYNKAFTMHGVVMVFFRTYSLSAATLKLSYSTNDCARDVAFPRLNLLSWYLFMTGGLLALSAAMTGGVDTGWTFYTPYSSTYANGSVLLAGMGAFVAAFLLF